MSCLIISSQYFFCLPLNSHTSSWGICTSFLHMPESSQPRFFILSMEGTPTLSWISSFLILYLLECSHIHLTVMISATLIFWTWEFLTSQHSALYNRVCRTTTLLNLHLSFSGTFLSHRTPEMSLHFVHPAPIRCETLSSISHFLD